MNAWTPGPWTYWLGSTVFEIGKSDQLIAQLNPDGRVDDEDEANARLIALSPEWPDALRQCVKMLDDCCQYALDLGPINRAKLEAARALLARLEGGEK